MRIVIWWWWYLHRFRTRLGVIRRLVGQGATLIARWVEAFGRRSRHWAVTVFRRCRIWVRRQVRRLDTEKLQDAARMTGSAMFVTGIAQAIFTGSLLGGAVTVIVGFWIIFLGSTKE